MQMFLNCCLFLFLIIQQMAENKWLLKGFSWEQNSQIMQKKKCKKDTSQLCHYENN